MSIPRIPQSARNAVQDYVRFDASKEDADAITLIVNRAMALAKKHGNPIHDKLSLRMDVTACHCNGCALDLQKLLAFDDFNFVHDVFGIRNHIDRETGKLTRCFLPRCHARSAA